MSWRGSSFFIRSVRTHVGEYRPGVAWLALCLALLAFSSSLLGAENPPLPCLWLHARERWVQPDGTVGQRYAIRLLGTESPAGQHCTGLRAFWRAVGRGNPPGGLFYPLPLRCKAAGCFADVHSPGPVFFEVLVQGRCGELSCSAQASGFLYGRKTASGPDAEATAPSKGYDPRPRLVLRPSPAHYYPQTGETYLFRYTAPAVPFAGEEGLHHARLNILSEQGTAIQEILPVNGEYSYTPAHEPALDRQGPEAAVERVLLVRERVNSGHTATFTLRLHRSRTAHLHRRYGLALFAGVAVLTFTLVLARKKQVWRR